MDLSVPGVSSDHGSKSAADMSSSSAGVPCGLDSSAALGAIALMDSSNRVLFDAGSQILVDDGSSTGLVLLPYVQPHASIAAEAMAFLAACEDGGGSNCGSTCRAFSPS